MHLHFHQIDINLLRGIHRNSINNSAITAFYARFWKDVNWSIEWSLMEMIKKVSWILTTNYDFHLVFNKGIIYEMSA